MVDWSVYRDINAVGPGWVDSLFAWLAVYLPAVIVGVVVLLFLLGWASRRAQRRRGAVTGTVAAAIALAINQPIAGAVGRVRPYVAHSDLSHLLISRSRDPSFPSDHATGAFALAVGVWFYDRLVGGVLLVLAAVLSFARVYAGTHYPFDVVGGAAIGIAVALVLRLAPIRGLLERLADLCSTVWERLAEILYPPARRTGTR